MAAKTKPAPEPMTFAEIANKRLRERIMQYRDLVHRHANGGQLDVEQMEAAADLMGITQPKVSDMLRGDFSNLSERKLMDCLTRLGYDIEIKVRPAKAGVGHLMLA